MAKKTEKKVAKKTAGAAVARKGKPGPRLSEEQRRFLLLLLSSGQCESAIGDVFRLVGWKPLSSSSLSYYRQLWAALIEEATQRRTDEALTAGLAVKAERVAALKDHAAMLEAIRFTPDKNGRLWNERAWRQTLEDIAIEMGDRKPKDAPQEAIIKVYTGFDPEKV